MGAFWQRRRVLLQRLIHLIKRTSCLVKEVVDDAPAKVTFILVIIHLQDLLESGMVNDLASGIG